MRKMQSGMPDNEAGLRSIMGSVRRFRYALNITLACIAIALEIYYSICGGSCAYLEGRIFGIDLEYVGIAYMALIMLLSIMKKDLLLFVMISAGVGIEFYLIGFQVWYRTYCLYCLAFAVVVFVLYIVNFIRQHVILSLVAMGLSLVFFAMFFEGSLAPTYTYTFLR